MPPASTSSSTTGGVAGSAAQSQSTTTGTSSTGAVSANPSGAATGTAGTTTETQAGVGASATASTGADLQAQIQNALKNEPTLSNDNINVTVSDDAIDLSGTVASGKEKQAAKRIAQSYAGNRKVKDHITVSGHGSENMSPSDKGTNPSTKPDDKGKPPQD
jgi:osmotically-inducible protein OsmY